MGHLPSLYGALTFSIWGTYLLYMGTYLLYMGHLPSLYGVLTFSIWGTYLLYMGHLPSLYGALTFSIWGTRVKTEFLFVTHHVGHVGQFLQTLDTGQDMKEKKNRTILIL